MYCILQFNQFALYMDKMYLDKNVPKSYQPTIRPGYKTYQKSYRLQYVLATKRIKSRIDYNTSWLQNVSKVVSTTIRPGNKTYQKSYRLQYVLATKRIKSRTDYNTSWLQNVSAIKRIETEMYQLQNVSALERIGSYRNFSYIFT
jgi:hypothetical protein